MGGGVSERLNCNHDQVLRKLEISSSLFRPPFSSNCLVCVCVCMTACLGGWRGQKLQSAVTGGEGGKESDPQLPSLPRLA